jgi:hypothetical protein
MNQFSMPTESSIQLINILEKTISTGKLTVLHEILLGCRGHFFSLHLKETNLIHAISQSRRTERRPSLVLNADFNQFCGRRGV